MGRATRLRTVGWPGETLTEASAQTWLDWHEDFLVKGNNDSAHERNGKLSFLSPDYQHVLGEVRLFNLGIFRLEPAPPARRRGSGRQPHRRAVRRADGTGRQPVTPFAFSGRRSRP
jgi:hypothetical protein